MCFGSRYNSDGNGEVLQTGQNTNLNCIPGRGKRVYSSPDRLWGQTCGLFNWHRVVKLTGRQAYLEEANAEIKNGRPIPPLRHTSSWRDT
jgi:hypothetical protein